MKIAKWIALVLVAGCVTGCVSPFYGTARIEKGWHTDVGLGPTSYIAGFGEPNSHFFGFRGDVEVCYGFNQYLQANARLGLGLGLREQRINKQSSFWFPFTCRLCCRCTSSFAAGLRNSSFKGRGCGFPL